MFLTNGVSNSARTAETRPRKIIEYIVSLVGLCANLIDVGIQYKCQDSGYANGAIEMPLEGHTASLACFTKEMPIHIKMVKETDGPVYVAWLNAPTAIETLYVARRS